MSKSGNLKEFNFDAFALQKINVMKFIFGIVLFFNLQTIHAQDSIIINYNNSVIKTISDSLVSNYCVFTKMDLSKYKKRKVKKDIEVIKTINSIFEKKKQPTMIYIYRHLKAVGLKPSYYIENISYIDFPFSYYLTVDGGYFSYIFYPKNDTEIFVHIRMNDLYVNCCLDNECSKIISIFDWEYFKTFLTPYLSHKIEIHRNSYSYKTEEALINFITD